MEPLVRFQGVTASPEVENKLRFESCTPTECLE